MNRRRPAALLVSFVALGGAIVYLLFTLWPENVVTAEAENKEPPWKLLDATRPFKRPQFPHDFRFPNDHGPHQGFHTEWWSLMGSLEDEHGERLGVQLTLIRLGLSPEPPVRTSQWAASDVYAGVFSISDASRRRLHTEVRTSRSAIGLAGADAEPRRVWVEDWQLEQRDATKPALALQVRSQPDEVTLALSLLSEKPLLDENAIRQPNTDRATPFHFYLEPRMRAHGRLRMGERELDVEGIVTLEHAWGELPLPGGPVALDRFTLHLSDGREVLLSRTHRVDGSGSPATTGLLIGADGVPLVLGSAEVQLSPTEYWNDGSGARYPIGWLLRIPNHALELVLSPYYDEHTGVAWLPFWAGPMRISTQAPNSVMVGNGLVQLSGYERPE